MVSILAVPQCGHVITDWSSMRAPSRSGGLRPRERNVSPVASTGSRADLLFANPTLRRTRRSCAGLQRGSASVRHCGAAANAKPGEAEERQLAIAREGLAFAGRQIKSAYCLLGCGRPTR